jgi:hypothetical protein
MPDETIVQGEPVAETATATTESETTTETQPLDNAAIQKQIADFQTQIKEITEASKRDIQSAKDKARAEVDTASRRASIAEAQSATVRASYRNLDPEVAQQLELAELRATRDQMGQLAQEEDNRRAFNQTIDTFEKQMNQFITDAGLDINDSRIDFGSRDDNLLERQRVFNESVAKIAKEKTSVDVSAIKAELSKEIEANLRKELGLDKVDTTVSGGAVSSDDKAFLENYGLTPITAADLVRFKKITGD